MFDASNYCSRIRLGCGSKGINWTEAWYGFNGISNADLRVNPTTGIAHACVVLG
ncbi:hypothetical protein SynPROS91_02361 [Synechococcus sp. PROS-9-1]|nr:hypothetical protein SynPROS91_02361 [Synechococcus sp. PROS-9-1]